jgi:hypothetical protein
MEDDTPDAASLQPVISINTTSRSKKYRFITREIIEKRGRIVRIAFGFVLKVLFSINDYNSGIV